MRTGIVGGGNVSARVKWLTRDCVELFFTRPYVLVARCLNTVTFQAFPGFVVCTEIMWGSQTVDGTPSCWTYEQFWNVTLQLRVASVDEILVLTTLENKTVSSFVTPCSLVGGLKERRPALNMVIAGPFETSLTTRQTSRCQPTRIQTLVI